jgi:hypothetical protein
MKASLSRLPVVIPIFVLVLIGVASVAFAWGSTSGGKAALPSAVPSANATTIPGNPRLGPGGQIGQIGQAPVFGTVASKTDATIVVTTTAGKSVTVNVTSTTAYSVRGVAAASLADIAVGARIAAQGTLNADGSLNATLVQTVTIGQPGSGGGRGGFGGGSGRGSGRGLPVPAPSAGVLGPST